VVTAQAAGDAAINASSAPSLERFLFTAEEVARALAVSTTLVRQLTLSGDLPCRRIGRLVRYTTADIASFVHSFDERGYR
jgi:excisionase family DNA binding protein